MALIDRTAYPRLPSSVSERDLAEVFTPTAEEAQWARERVIEPQDRLVLLVMLKCYQRLGYFPQLDQVPLAVTEHVHARAMEPAGERIASHGRLSVRMLRRCRGLVRQRTGTVWDPDRVHAVAETAMRDALQGKDNPADVINVALEALTGQGCELPAYSMLDRLAGRLRAEVNGGFHRLVAGRLDVTDRARLAGLLVVDPATRHSAWPALTRPAGRATVSKLKQHIAFLAWLDSIGDSGRWLADLPPAKISHFAGEAAVLDIDELSRAGENKRWTLLACVVHTARTRARDEVVTMFCKRMAAITSKAQDKLKELREEHRAESERLLGVFGDVLAGVRETLGPTGTGQGSTIDDEQDAGNATAAGVEAEPIAVVAERAGRMLLKTLHEAGGVAGLSAVHEEVSAHHGNNYTPLMERYYRSHRAALFAMLDVLELEATSADRAVTDAVTVLLANRKRTGEYIPGHHDGKTIDVSFASEGWQATLRDRRRAGKLRRRHFEVCVFAHLAAELRNGNIAVAGSQEYADLHAQLMTWTECEPQAGEY
ncbi:MAG: DUF4158 domain-containing protein, partial [Streptosporangiaceae bacterium]